MGKPIRFTHNTKHSMIIQGVYPFNLDAGQDIFAMARSKGVPGNATVRPLDSGSVEFTWSAYEEGDV